ncbi:MAG: DNA polymerase I [Clostridia bacterium]|nr:DNA polymerase I [Clostridia bacterium]
MSLLPEKFVLIDGNSLLYRAFYAIPMLSNSKGFITNAVYGFCNMLLKILNEEKPDYVAVAFDKGKRVFRHRDYEQYKATRKPMPDELRPQLPVLKELLCAMKIALFECEDYEADDIIGALSLKGEGENLQVLIVTGDRDALQLVSAYTNVLLTRKGITEMDRYNEAVLQEKYGLTPEQMIDLKGLMGDSSDNIPGIPGVGEKTALKLMQDYGSLENVLAHAQDFAGKKLGGLLVEYADLARLSRKLAVIERTLPLELNVADCRTEEPDYEKVLELLKELEFKGIIQTILEKRIASAPRLFVPEAGAGQPAERRIDNARDLENYLQAQKGTEMVLWLTTHRPGVSGLAIKEIGLQFPEETGEPLFLSWADEQVLREMLDRLKPWLEDEKIKKTVHDAKTAILACQAHHVHIQGIEKDTLLMAYLLNPSRPQGEPVTLRNLPVLAAEYAQSLRKQGMWELYYDLELPLSGVLAEMETAGVLLDQAVLQEMGEELDARIAVLVQEVYRQAGETFNINSPKQLGEILFGKLGLAKGKKTKTGYSTSAEVLEALALEHEIVAAILHYRQLAKIKTTYIDGLGALMDPQTRKVHTSFNQTVTATGRLSSTEPNLQNIPIRLEEGRRLRRAFLPSPGHLLLTADYSQIELRVLAHIAQDEVLMEAFHLGQDIHTRTASEVFGAPMDKVTKEMRRAAKAVNFGIVYGISDFGLSQDLGISRAEAKEYIDNYFRRYHGVRFYIERIIAEARQQGYVTTLLNRRRYLPDILSRNFNLRSFAERTAMNTPIQGSAADIIKLAMLRMQEVLKQEQRSVMILQVHDELIFDVPAAEVMDLARTVNEIMSGVYPLCVSLQVDLQKGPNWYELEKIIL